MLHNNLKSQFQAKEQELFEIHLQHNAHSRNLFEQVLRKNNQIIKNCLQRFNELYSRFEEYDSNFIHLNQQLGKIHEINNNFHYQFRRTHLQNQKKQSHLSNDILMIKNALKIPGKDTPTEVYLQSDFFKSRINKLNQRKKQNGQSQGNFHQNANSFTLNQSSLKQNSISIDQEVQGHNLIKTQSSKTNEKPQKSKRKKEQSPRLSVKQDKYEQELQNLINSSVTKDEFDNKLTDIKNRLQMKIDSLAQSDTKKCKHNNAIDFKQINQYIEERIQLIASSKVSKDYLQTSLLNLKQAWQEEQRGIYRQLETKSSIQQIQQMQRQIKQLRQQIRNKKNQFNHSLNKSCNFPIQNTSPRATFKEETSNDGRNEYIKQNIEEAQSHLRKNLAFSNSLSVLRGSQRKKHKFATIDHFGSQAPAITDKVWKERVIGVLGQGQTIKKVKVQK